MHHLDFWTLILYVSVHTVVCNICFITYNPLCKRWLPAQSFFPFSKPMQLICKSFPEFFIILFCFLINSSAFYICFFYKIFFRIKSSFFFLLTMLRCSWSKWIYILPFSASQLSSLISCSPSNVFSMPSQSLIFFLYSNIRWFIDLSNLSKISLRISLVIVLLLKIWFSILI